MKKNILILGSDGMVGRVVFEYLYSLYPDNVWGTTRKTIKSNKRVLSYTVENSDRNFKHIKNHLKKIDYIINCIALLKNVTDKNELITTNALFPHQLEIIAELYKSKLIHISTDGVFSPQAGIVDEVTIPGPPDDYGASKLLGETNSKQALTVRSSFIGFDPINHKGLLEWALHTKKINGNSTAKWTGCTSLQFAQFCDELVSRGLWEKLRKKTPIIHFAPLGPISKFQILKTVTKMSNKQNSIKKISGEKRNVQLTSCYLDLLMMSQYTNDIQKALQELISFEASLQYDK